MSDGLERSQTSSTHLSLYITFVKQDLRLWMTNSIYLALPRAIQHNAWINDYHLNKSNRHIAIIEFWRSRMSSFPWNRKKSKGKVKPSFRANIVGTLYEVNLKSKWIMEWYNLWITFSSVLPSTEKSWYTVCSCCLPCPSYNIPSQFLDRIFTVCFFRRCYWWELNHLTYTSPYISVSPSVSDANDSIEHIIRYII